MLIKIASTTLIASLLLAAAPAAPAAPGEPGSSPTFSNPTDITNPLVAFRTGAVKVFRGKDEGARTAVLFTHQEDTRVFAYQGNPVECCIIEEKAFEEGALVEVTHHYLAQDDQGNVRYFGEISVEYEGGIIVGPEPDNWLVGGASEPEDPPETHAVTEPTMFMPANPQLGDVFSQENFVGSDETLEVVGVGVKVRVPAGKYVQAVKLRETDAAENAPPQFVWVVPGVGVVKEKGKRCQDKLMATSLIEATELETNP